MYLRNFSINEKNINVYSRDNCSLITATGSISKQCQKNYMYSQNLVFENALGDLETKTKPILSKIMNDCILPKKNTADYWVLLNFILYQASRTLFAADDLNNTTETLLKTMLKEEIRLSGRTDISLEDIERAKISYPEPAVFNIQMTSLMIPIIYDLGCKLIINNSLIDFITSDNPVVFYNKYYINDFRSGTGLSNKGLLIFFPVSPKYSVVLFDKTIYRVGGKKTFGNIKVRNEEDILQINALQIINSHQSFYAKHHREQNIKRVCDIINNDHKMRNKPVENVSLRMKDGSIKKNVLQISKRKINLDCDFSFIKINKNIPERYLQNGIIRDPFICKVNDLFIEKVQSKELKVKDWNSFFKDKLENGL